MQAVSFMYVRPPGYNPESAKAAEINDQREKEEMVNNETPQTNAADAPSSSVYYLRPSLCLVFFCFQ